MIGVGSVIGILFVKVVSFKKDVYRRVMKEFAPVALPFIRKDVKRKRR